MHSWCVDSRIAVSLPPWVDLGKYIDCNMQLTDGICVPTNMINMNVFIQMAQSVKRQTLSQVQYFCPAAVSCIPGNWISCILF